VLLVDADLRRPVLHRLFNALRSPGLSDYLKGTTKFDNVVEDKVLENLDVIFSGSVTPNPAEIWDSRGMKEFIRTAGQLYDVVLLDSAPLLAVADAAILASQVDGALLVVSTGETTVPEVSRAKEVLDKAGAKVLGVLLNNFDPPEGVWLFGPIVNRIYGYDPGEHVAPLSEKAAVCGALESVQERAVRIPAERKGSRLTVYEVA
jgi:capsular exopolysaccharide synthesis family protein